MLYQGNLFIKQLITSNPLSCKCSIITFRAKMNGQISPKNFLLTSDLPHFPFLIEKTLIYDNNK